MAAVYRTDDPRKTGTTNGSLSTNDAAFNRPNLKPLRSGAAFDIALGSHSFPWIRMNRLAPSA